jgi:hypothetical protein
MEREEKNSLKSSAIENAAASTNRVDVLPSHTVSHLIFTALIITDIIGIFDGSKAVQWLRRLVAGLSPRRPGFDPGPVHVGFVVDKVALGQVFPPKYFGFSLSISFHRCSITRKSEKTLIIITGLQNKP